MKKIIALLSAMVLFVLVGCVPNEVTTSTLYIHNDGTVEAYFVEDFDSSIYSFSEFQSYVNEEIEDYNLEHSASVELMNLSIDETNVMLRIKYPMAIDYERMNGVTCFYGTIAEAKADGYDFESMDSRDDSAFILIVSESIQIMTEHNIVYMSDSVSEIDKHIYQVTVDDSSNDGNVGILIFE